MPGELAAETLTGLSITELLFWTATFVILAVVLWRVRDRKLDLPRVPILILAMFFLASHFFFDTYENYLEIEPGQGLPGSFLARAGIEALETLGFLFLILISLRVREAGHTIERQKEQLDVANQQLLRAAKLASVGELASGMAHEINNPIGIILGRTDYVLTTQQELPAEVKDDLKVVRNQAERVATTVRGLLTFARPSPLRIQRVDLGRIVDEAIALETPRCKTAKVEIQRSATGKIPNIEADPDRLQQVLVNLMNNAIDAMPKGGRLSVSIANGTGKDVMVNVSDTGVGISEEDQARIFDPFFTTKPAGKGTGLGLAVSYGIVRDHGGEIRVNSLPGKGTTFTVVLPVESNGNGRSRDSRS
ncbi:MAG TPA: ATP-binding protein [Terriglobales bacterium]|nr:ATP-binding protein [Terriglobales bacterium]